MSTNKKFRIQNGVDITGEVVVGNQLVITAEGKLVLPAITEAVNEAVATDIAALQAQVDAILGTSPEHLDTLQEIVALFQSEDGDIQTLITNNSTAITQIQQTLASGVATAAQGALADTAAQQADLDAVIAQITDGVATTAQGAKADTAVQPEDFGAGISTSTATVPDWGLTATYTTDSEIATPPPEAYGSASNSTHFAVYSQAYAGGQQVKYMNLYTMSGSPVKNIGVSDDAIATFSETNFALVVSGTATVYDLNGDSVSSWSVPFTDNRRGLAFYGSDKLVVGGQSNSVYVYDWTDGTLLSTITISSGAEISSISVSGDKAFVGNWRGGSSNSGEVVIIDLSTNSIESTISNLAGSVNDDYFGLNVASNDTHFAVSRKNKAGDFNHGSVEVFKISDNSHTGSVQFSIASSTELGWGFGKQRIQFAEDRILVLGTSGETGFIVSAPLDTPTTDVYVLSLGYPHHSGEMFLSGSDIVILGGNKISKLSTLSGDVITSYGVDTSVIATKDYVDSGVAGVDLSGYTDTSDMTTAIATAQTAAEATAAADATAKADAAQAAAIASASADATAKADQAETDAKAYADQVVAATVDAAPAALDTLNELAAALGDDANFASTVTSSIATKADDAATTAALATKVGLAEVDVRMEPIKQLAESAVQPSSFGSGISSTTASGTVDPTGIDGTTFTAIGETSGIYSHVDYNLGTAGDDNHVATLTWNSDAAELWVNVHTIDGTFVKSFMVSDGGENSTYGQGHLSHMSLEDNIICVSRANGYVKVYDISNIADGDHGLINYIDDPEFRKTYYIGDNKVVSAASNYWASMYRVDWYDLSTSSIYHTEEIDAYGPEVTFYERTLMVAAAKNLGMFNVDTYAYSSLHPSQDGEPSTQDDQSGYGHRATISGNYIAFTAFDNDGGDDVIHLFDKTDLSYIRTFDPLVKNDPNSPYDINVDGYQSLKGMGHELKIVGDYVLAPISVDHEATSSELWGAYIGIWKLSTGEFIKLVFAGEISDSSMLHLVIAGENVFIGTNGGGLDSYLYHTTMPVAAGVTTFSVDTSVFATKAYADQAAAGVDLSTYATTAQMNTAIAAESAARTLAVSEEATQRNAADSAIQNELQGKIDDEEAARILAVSEEATQRNAADSSLQNQIDIIVGSSPETLDTLQEIVTAFENADSTLTGTVAANSAALATKADDAATTAALATKVGLAEVDVRMEPIKQLAESAIQAEDFGSGISLSSQTLVDWSSDSVLQTPATIAAPSSVTSDAWAYGTIIANNSTKWATNDWLHDGDKGRVYVFNQSDNSLAFTLDGTSSGERMGSTALIMNDEYIVAGSYNYNGQQGRVHVFSAVDGSPLYILEPDNVPNPWNQFKGRFGGRGLALEGSNLYVGCTEHITIGDGNVDGQNEAGAVYHFDLSTGNKVSRIENPIAEGYASNKWFGREISVHGNNVYVSYGNSHGGLHHYTLSDSTLTLQNSFAFGGISGLGDGANSQFGQQTDTNGTYFIAYAPMNQGTSGEFGVIVYKNEDLHNGVFEPIYNIDTTNAYGGLLFIDGNVIAAGVGSSDSIQIYTLGDTLSEVVTGQALSAGNIFSKEGTDGGAKPFAYLSGSSKFIYRTEQSSTDIGMYDVVSSSTSSYIVDDSVFATKDYVDSGVAGVDLSGYTDTSGMTSAIATAQAAAEATASADATAKADAAQAAAEATASADATAKADAAQAAAEATASASATANATAIVSATATASADATAKADAAQAAAEATASADATSKADAAQAAAEATASSDATSKADAAQAAAEATASADATAKADAAQAAAEAYADSVGTSAIADVIDAAPASLDTLNELAAALGDDANFASTVTDSIATKADAAQTASDIADVAAAASANASAIASATASATANATAIASATATANANATAIVDLQNQTTDDVPEGDINKYWTEERVKTALTGGLCINDTKLQATGEIAVDEVEAEASLRVAEAVVSDDTTKLEGQGGSHYRIDIYDVNGTIVN